MAVEGENSLSIALHYRGQKAKRDEAVLADGLEPCSDGVTVHWTDEELLPIQK